MPRKPNWKTNQTKAIRVPEHLADELLRLARSIENQGGFVQNEQMETCMVSLQGAGDMRREIIAAPATVWREAEGWAEEMMLHPGIKKLTPNQRGQLALLLVERGLFLRFPN